MTQAAGSAPTARLRARVPLLVLLLTLGLAACAPGAAARPAGGGLAAAGARPDAVELSGVPAHVTGTVGVAQTVTIEGKELHELTAEPLPGGIEPPEKKSEEEWVLKGTPTTAGTTHVTVLATNAASEPTEAKIEWTVYEPPSVTSPGSQLGTVGVPVELHIGGAQMHELTAEPLPAGLKLKLESETSAEIVGTPTAAGTTTVELQATNPAGDESAVQSFDWTIYEPASVTDPGEQTSTEGTPVALHLEGAGMRELTAAPLPAGLELKLESETSAEIVGTPTAAGTTTVELQATNAAGARTAVQTFAWTVLGPSSPPPIPTGTLGVSPGTVFSAVRASCGGASWSGATAVATQWLLDGAAIPGATASTYIPSRSDDGHSLACRQTATAADGASAVAISAARAIHELPPQPSWPISPAAQHCTTPVCMQDGAGAGEVRSSYEQGGAWWSARQVRCVSAPWTSMAGDSSQAAIAAFAEAQTIEVTLQRMTVSGPLTVASQRLSGLASPRDALDGAAGASPFAGTILVPYGAQKFAAGELWASRYPASVGQPDWLAPGGGLLAYEVTGAGGVQRSFQLTYTLAAADRAQRLRCVVSAQDGPAAGPTEASFTSAEYQVSASPACAPRKVAPGGPQPAVLQIGNGTCLFAPAGPGALGAGFQGAAVRGGRLALSLDCSLPGGCPGTLTLVAGSRRVTVATAKVRVGRGASRLVRLGLDAAGRRLLRAAGAGGLQVSARFGAGRALGSLRLLKG